jgi:hypothetical protein
MSDSIAEVNKQVYAALLAKYKDEAAAKEAFRTLDTAKLLQIAYGNDQSKWPNIGHSANNVENTTHDRKIL